jgi:hypothetical protein
MFEILFMGLLIVLILTFFYKQAVYEFRINQIDWGQREGLVGLLTEKVPAVVRDVPRVAFWTHEDVMMREAYSFVRVFEDVPISDWLVRTKREEECPWDVDHGRALADVAGIEVWAERELHPLVQSNPLLAAWYRPEASCWSGGVGLWKARAPWTCLFVTEGAIQVSVMPGKFEKSLPTNWRGMHLGKITAHDTPFAADLKFLDIVLRPGHCLFLPSHWYASWSALEGSELCPMVCKIEYHTPVSWMARRLAEKT